MNWCLFGRYSNSPESGISTSHTSLPDADFPEYYDAPALGTCRALYPFEGEFQNIHQLVIQCIQNIQHKLF